MLFKPSFGTHKSTKITTKSNQLTRGAGEKNKKKKRRQKLHKLKLPYPEKNEKKKRKKEHSKGFRQLRSSLSSHTHLSSHSLSLTNKK